MPTEAVGICELMLTEHPFGRGVARRAGLMGSQRLVLGNQPLQQSCRVPGRIRRTLVRMPAGLRLTFRECDPSRSGGIRRPWFNPCFYVIAAFGYASGGVVMARLDAGRAPDPARVL